MWRFLQSWGIPSLRTVVVIQVVVESRVFLGPHEVQNFSGFATNSSQLVQDAPENFMVCHECPNDYLGSPFSDKIMVHFIRATLS